MLDIQVAEELQVVISMPFRPVLRPSVTQSMMPRSMMQDFLAEVFESIMFLIRDVLVACFVAMCTVLFDSGKKVYDWLAAQRFCHRLTLGPRVFTHVSVGLIATYAVLCTAWPSWVTSVGALSLITIVQSLAAFTITTWWWQRKASITSCLYVSIISFLFYRELWQAHCKADKLASTHWNAKLGAQLLREIEAEDSLLLVQQCAALPQQYYYCALAGTRPNLKVGLQNYGWKARWGVSGGYNTPWEAHCCFTGTMLWWVRVVCALSFTVMLTRQLYCCIQQKATQTTVSSRRPRVTFESSGPVPTRVSDAVREMAEWSKWQMEKARSRNAPSRRHLPKT